MDINLEMIKTAIAAVIMLAIAVERGVQLFKPLFLKITDENWQDVAKLGAAILLGFVLAFLIRVDTLTMLGFNFAPVAGYAVAGLLASGGASVWHDILEWLETIKEK